MCAWYVPVSIRVCGCNTNWLVFWGCDMFDVNKVFCIQRNYFLFVLIGYIQVYHHPASNIKGDTKIIHRYKSWWSKCYDQHCKRRVKSLTLSARTCVRTCAENSLLAATANAPRDLQFVRFTSKSHFWPIFSSLLAVWNNIMGGDQHKPAVTWPVNVFHPLSTADYYALRRP